MKDQINELLQRKMDRRDFLKHVGIGTVSLFGLGALLKTLTSLEPQKAANTPKNEVNLSYSAGAYGGRRVS